MCLTQVWDSCFANQEVWSLLVRELDKIKSLFWLWVTEEDGLLKMSLLCVNVSGTVTEEHLLYVCVLQADLIGEACWPSGGPCWCCGSAETKWPSHLSSHALSDFWLQAELISWRMQLLFNRVFQSLTAPPKNLRLYLPSSSLCSRLPPLPCIDLATSLTGGCPLFLFTQGLSRPSRCRKCLLFNQEGIIFLIKYRE